MTLIYQMAVNRLPISKIYVPVFRPTSKMTHFLNTTKFQMDKYNLKRNN